MEIFRRLGQAFWRGGESVTVVCYSNAVHFLASDGGMSVLLKPLMSLAGRANHR